MNHCKIIDKTDEAKKKKTMKAGYMEEKHIL